MSKKRSRITKIKPIDPVPSKCITVDSKDRLFTIGENIYDGVATHNSVGQALIINSCIMRPDHWYFLGIDLKKVELSIYRPYRNVVLEVATTLEDAVRVLRFAAQTMMERYSEMEALGTNNYEKVPGHSKALYIMIDEGGELLQLTKNKSLVGSTIVQTVQGPMRLDSLQIGDVVYDPNFDECAIEDIYEPIVKQPYNITIIDKGNETEHVFTAGDEHLWECVIVKNGNKHTQVLTTEEIKQILDQNKTLPVDKRERVFMVRKTLATLE